MTTWPGGGSAGGGGHTAPPLAVTRGRGGPVPSPRAVKFGVARKKTEPCVFSLCMYFYLPYCEPAFPSEIRDKLKPDEKGKYIFSLFPNTITVLLNLLSHRVWESHEHKKRIRVWKKMEKCFLLFFPRTLNHIFVFWICGGKQFEREYQTLRIFVFPNNGFDGQLLPCDRGLLTFPITHTSPRFCMVISPPMLVISHYQDHFTPLPLCYDSRLVPPLICIYVQNERFYLFNILNRVLHSLKYVPFRDEKTNGQANGKSCIGKQRYYWFLFH